MQNMNRNPPKIHVNNKHSQYSNTAFLVQIHKQTKVLKLTVLLSYYHCFTIHV